MARPLPIIANTWRVTVQGTQQSGANWANVCHFRWLGAGTPDLTAITALDALLMRFYSGAALGGGAAYSTKVNTGVKWITNTYLPLDGTGLAYALPETATGAAATNTLPPEVAPVITLRTRFRGRRYRGRMFLVAPTTANTDAGGNFLATFITTTVLQFNGMLGTLAPNWEMVVASYGYSETKSGVVTWTPFATKVDSATMDIFPDVQRRRKQ